MFGWLSNKQADGSDSLSHTLAEKSLIMIVGPSAVGKSAVMSEVVRRNPSFGRVTSFTTRRPRSDEEAGTYRYISREEAETLIRKSKTVQYAIHPTTNMIYGSTLNDYPNKYNMLDTLSSAVIELESLPFKQTMVISITTPADQWRDRFLARYPGPSDEALKRLEEARQSIEWSLAHPKIYWLSNPQGGLPQVAAQLIELAKYPERHTSVPPEPHAILELIERGLW